MHAMKRRLAAAFTLLAMLAIAGAPAHSLALSGGGSGPDADLCVAGAERTPAPGAPADDRRHPCDRCDGCLGTGAALPPAAAAAPAPRRLATKCPPAVPVARPHAALAAPLARGPPRAG